jgi:hypothetical protein
METQVEMGNTRGDFEYIIGHNLWVQSWTAKCGHFFHGQNLEKASILEHFPPPNYRMKNDFQFCDKVHIVVFFSREAIFIVFQNEVQKYIGGNLLNFSNNILKYK